MPRNIQLSTYLSLLSERSSFWTSQIEIDFATLRPLTGNRTHVRDAATIRVGKPADPAFLMKVPSGGIPGRSGVATGSANYDLFQLDDAGTIEQVLKPNGQGVRIFARNPSDQRIPGPVSSYDLRRSDTNPFHAKPKQFVQFGD